MQLTYEDKQKRTIKNKEIIEFSSFSSYHLLAITARAKSEKQLGKNATDDEDLTVQIDDKTFSVLNSDRLKDSPTAFSGGKLHNLAKTIYFLTFLKGKNHTITLETDEKPNTAFFEGLEVYTLNIFEETLTLEINQQAEDGDRRSWLTFVLDNLPLKSVTPTVTFSRRKRDGDDIKIIINGKTQKNILRKIKHFLWRFVGSLLPRLSPTKTETNVFTVDLPQRLGYIEFEADRMPILEKIAFDFDTIPALPKGIPTVDNPRWTKDFYEDTENILLARLILGEAENEPKEAKIWAAGSVLNRVKTKAWPNIIHEVILQPNQYDPFKIKDPNFDKITDPFGKDVGGRRKNEWQESHAIARGILSGEIENPTEATHFHGQGVSKEWFLDNIVPQGRFIKQIGNTYFYWSPN